MNKGLITSTVPRNIVNSNLTGCHLEEWSDEGTHDVLNSFLLNTSIS